MKKKGLIILSLLIAACAIVVSLFHLFKSNDDEQNQIDDETTKMAEGSESEAKERATQSRPAGESQSEES